jgi:hypothetical protein
MAPLRARGQRTGSSGLRLHGVGGRVPAVSRKRHIALVPWAWSIACPTRPGSEDAAAHDQTTHLEAMSSLRPAASAGQQPWAPYDRPLRWDHRRAPIRGVRVLSRSCTVTSRSSTSADMTVGGRNAAHLLVRLVMHPPRSPRSSERLVPPSRFPDRDRRRSQGPIPAATVSWQRAARLSGSWPFENSLESAPPAPTMRGRAHHGSSSAPSTSSSTASKGVSLPARSASSASSAPSCARAPPMWRSSILRHQRMPLGLV